MIALVDYGIGNLRSVQKALETVGADVRLTSDPALVLEAEGIVLPGVGAFPDGMAGLEACGLIEPLRTAAVRGTPLLGICLGMQVLFEVGEELGLHAGLGLLPGQVRRFHGGEGLKIPQTGWNQILPLRKSPLLSGLPKPSYTYFNHGYYCVPSELADVLACTEYGVRYASVVERGRLYGVQFHPEKSQSVGLAILRNFVILVLSGAPDEGD